MKKIGLYFGSFNPIHIGHLIVATTIRNLGKFDEVWFIISPHNPFKSIEHLANEKHRLKMCQLAIKDHPYLIASDVEFELEKPSYTIYTLKHLRNQYHNVDFQLIMGEDNLQGFKKWKSYQEILASSTIHVYNRSMALKNSVAVNVTDLYNHDRIHFYDVPLLNISSTYIRNQIEQNQSIDFLTTKEVISYLKEFKIYESS